MAKNIRTTLLLILSLLLLSCTGEKKEKSEAEGEEQTEAITYEKYYNDRYDYEALYPTVLISKGESGSQDGITFTSEDGRVELLIYRDFKIDIEGGDMYLDLAIEQDKENYHPDIIEKDASSYTFEGELEDGLVYRRYTLNSGGELDYYTVYMSFPKDEATKWDPVFLKVKRSLKTD